jgi:transcriptional regulator with GAF, ATPase, and Fis domain
MAGAQLLRRPDDDVGHDDPDEQPVARVAGDEDQHEQRHHDRVDRCEQVRPQDLSDGALGPTARPVDAAGCHPVRDLVGGETGGDTIGVENLPYEIRQQAPETSAPAVAPVGTTLAEIEKNVILQTLEQFDGNRTKTAEALGISRRSLQMKLKEYEIN